MTPKFRTVVLIVLAILSPSCGKDTMPILGSVVGVAHGLHSARAYAGETLARARGAAELNCLPERVEVRARGSELYDVECAYRIATIACRTDGGRAERTNFCWVESRRDVEVATSSHESKAVAPVEESAQAAVLRTLRTTHRETASRIQTQCKAKSGPRGTGRATFTVQPNGTTTDVALDTPWEKTDVGACIREEFLRTVIPPFEGEPVRISKTFSL